VSKDRDFRIFGNHWGSESEKYWWNKDLDGGKVVGIMRICIVNARDSEPQKLPRLTSAATKQIVVCDVVPRQDLWKGHRGSFNRAENAAVRLL
jgi:hypothetical protein